jgi:hypothetical protein
MRGHPAKIAGRKGPFRARWLKYRPSVRFSALIPEDMSQAACHPHELALL